MIDNMYLERAQRYPLFASFNRETGVLLFLLILLLLVLLSRLVIPLCFLLLSKAPVVFVERRPAAESVGCDDKDDKDCKHQLDER